MDTKPGPDKPAMSLQARAFIASYLLAGVAILGYAAFTFHSYDLVHFFWYLALAILASGMKLKLPGIPGHMSVGFLVSFLCVIDLGFSEGIVIVTIAMLVQCLWNLKQRRPEPIQIAFNLAVVALATAAAYTVYHGTPHHSLHLAKPLLLALAGTIYFAVNSLSVATVISLTEHKRMRNTWQEFYAWTLLYHLAGTGIAGVVSWANRQIGWQSFLLFLPLGYLVYRSYCLYIEKLDHENEHAGEIASLHLRTIEALALAIEAKDHITHDHLRRVQVYAVEIAKELGLSGAEQEALRAAAVLHDIGKLAVPEHIISKPGRLTPEEFDKMKIHPIVGAEILERVQFPYAVAPIVRWHHEKWNGCGYPDGLAGEQIPLGARILAAVDCLDALASDRQYRRALPLDEAMRQVVSESGTSFDPKVVEILQRRYIELERLAESQSQPAKGLPPSPRITLEKQVQPARGFQQVASVPLEENFLSSIGAARQEAQTLFQLSHDLGNSLSLAETLSVFSLRLKKLVPYDSIAIYTRKEERLSPAHVGGDNFRLFSSLEIPLGQGLSGWVAENHAPIINGDPAVEPGYIDDPVKYTTLRSALSVPLDGLAGVIGVLTLYKAEGDAFTKDHLRILLAISSKLGISMENALKYQQAENSAVTDYLTNLPNARSLFRHLDRELARCQRANTPLAVMVCDIDDFKQINDRFGHLEGNKVLRLFSQGLRSVCREYDYVGRMGGDEFVIIAPGLTPEAAQEKAARLNRFVMEAARHVCGEGFLSVSVGTAFYLEDGFDADELLAEADRRMYSAKQKRHEAKRMRRTARVEISPIDVKEKSLVIN